MLWLKSDSELQVIILGVRLVCANKSKVTNHVKGQERERLQCDLSLSTSPPS